MANRYQFIDKYISNKNQGKLPIIADFIDTINPISADDIKNSIDINKNNLNTLNDIKSRFTDGKANKAINADKLNGELPSFYATASSVSNLDNTTTSTINSINDTINGVISNVSNLNIAVGNASNRVDGVESDISNISNTLDNTINDLSNTSSRVSGIENNFSIDPTNNTITIGSVITTNLTVDSKNIITEINNINNSITSTINTINSNTSDLSNSIRALDNQISDVNNAISNTQNAIIETGENLGQYQPKINTNTQLQVGSIRFGNSNQKITNINYSGDTLFITTSNVSNN